jgi:hypothetical protein
VRNLRNYLKNALANADRNLESNASPELKLYWQGVRDTVVNAQHHLDEDTESAMANFYAIVDGANRQ